MPDQIPYLRVFISSPGDVTDERKIALDVIERLPNRPAFRDRVAFRIVAWDKVGAGTPMRATLTPQEAINEGLPKPSECDLVVVLFWSRMGTPFINTDGREYMSGTHWELLDALNSTRAETLIYRRTEKKLFEVTDIDGQEQYRKVDAFFKSDLFYKDGRIQRGLNTYAAPDDFRQQFETHFEEMVVRLLKKVEAGTPRPPDPVTTPRIVTVESKPWVEGKSPFPGLRAFTEDDVEIFFGRGRETDQLVRRVADQRFVAVVGASGSGKSSLVGAGLLPRLHANAISGENVGSKDWFIASMKPGKAPFESLAAALMDAVPALVCDNPRMYVNEVEKFAAELSEKPERLAKTLQRALKNEKTWAEVLLFIDQFEELFTLANADDATRFAAMLAQPGDKTRVVVTMRDDFYHRANAYQDLSDLLQSGSFPLTIPRRDALRQMIERPAERARIVFESGLVEQILDDTGDEPGNLALMAYALDELYKLSSKGEITFENYRLLGGVKGAIGTRAENTFAALQGDEATKISILQRVFHHLIEVDVRGAVTRQRVAHDNVTVDMDMETFVKAFVDARLLITSENMIEVAHEALLRGWTRLAAWIDATTDDRRLISRMKREAEEWQRQDKPDFLLPTSQELNQFHNARNRLGMRVNDPLVIEFCEPQQKRLLRELRDLNTSHQRRSEIGDRLAIIDDTRSGVGAILIPSTNVILPDIDWCHIAQGGSLVLEDRELGLIGSFKVLPFYISRYLITDAQFGTFLKASDGFNNDRWWQAIPDEYKKQKMSEQRTKSPNAPRDSISWYQAVAFSRWVNFHYQQNGLLPGDDPNMWQIRLPTEWEWEWAAQNGTEEREYPWGREWREGLANTKEAELNHTIAVGMYPEGAAASGALDMAGNLWEWCLNDYDNPQILDGYDNGEEKVLRGGSFGYAQFNAVTWHRFSDGPYGKFSGYGLRLVLAPTVTLISG